MWGAEFWCSRVVVMKQVSVNVKTEIGRIEDSLLCLWEGFTLHKLQLTQAYRCAQALLARRESGFSSREEAALYEKTLSHAIQDYFRLRDQIDWWLAQAHQLVAALMEIERQASSMDASIREFNRKRARACEFEEEPAMLLIELELVF
jgi:hypothetical protein